MILQKVIIIIILLIIITMILYYRNKSKNIKILTRHCCSKSKNIKILMRQCCRWAIAAKQDKNAFIALLHANYAAGYLWALFDIANDNEIINNTGIDPVILKKKITNIQDISSRNMMTQCDMQIEDKYLFTIAGNL